MNKNSAYSGKKLIVFKEMNGVYSGKKWAMFIQERNE